MLSADKFFKQFGPISGHKFIKHFSCSTHLSMKFQLLIKTKLQTFLAFNLSDVACFNMLINVKMPTSVGIITFMSMLNFVLSSVEHEKSLAHLRFTGRSL